VVEPVSVNFCAPQPYHSESSRIAALPAAHQVYSYSIDFVFEKL